MFDIFLCFSLSEDLKLTWISVVPIFCFRLNVKTRLKKWNTTTSKSTKHRHRRIHLNWFLCFCLCFLSVILNYPPFGHGFAGIPGCLGRSIFVLFRAEGTQKDGWLIKIDLQYVGVVIFPTQTIQYHCGNPSKLSWICIVRYAQKWVI